MEKEKRNHILRKKVNMLFFRPANRVSGESFLFKSQHMKP